MRERLRETSKIGIQGYRRLDAWRQIAIAGVFVMPLIGLFGDIYSVRTFALPAAGIGIVGAELLAVRCGWDLPENEARDTTESNTGLLKHGSGLKLYAACTAPVLAILYAENTYLPADFGPLSLPLLSIGLDAVYVQSIVPRGSVTEWYTLGIPLAGSAVLYSRATPVLAVLFQSFGRSAWSASQRGIARVRDWWREVQYDPVGGDTDGDGEENREETETGDAGDEV